MSYETATWIVYSLLVIYEIAIFSAKTTKRRRLYLGSFLLCGTVFVHTALLLTEPLIFGIPFFIIGLYRAFNSMRYIFSRMHDTYLYKVVGSTSIYIGCIQAIFGIITALFGKQLATESTLIVIVTLAALCCVVLLFTTLRTLRSAMVALPAGGLALAQAPSVTVAIPARNETEDLEACLKSIVASTYQKLEILVLDDCSQDRTSDIIKQFAHDGVRFVQGTEPGESWLAKNAAYDKLADEASGDILLFCGVDVRVDPDTISKLVYYYQKNKLSMLSVLPKRLAEAEPASVIQLIRYAWELALPRNLHHRPPVLSTVWMMNAKDLRKHGGMRSVKRMIVPEAYFAKILAKNNSYQFISASNELPIYSMKRLSDQRQTSLRVRYPQLHKRPEKVLALTLAELLFFVLPIVLIATYALHDSLYILLVAFIALVSSFLIFVTIARHVQSHIRISLLQCLYAAVLDIGLVHISMYKYELGSIAWKQRNVCLPIMHVIPRLPPLV